MYTHNVLVSLSLSKSDKQVRRAFAASTLGHTYVHTAGAAASLSEAISLNLLAAQTLSQVLYDTTPSTPQALSQRSAVAESWQATAETAPASAAAVKSDAPAESASDTDSESASATESASANEFALAVDVDMDVDESFEFEVSIDTSDFDQSEESEMTLKLELHADEEWKNVAKVCHCVLASRCCIFTLTSGKVLLQQPEKKLLAYAGVPPSKHCRQSIVDSQCRKLTSKQCL